MLEGTARFSLLSVTCFPSELSAPSRCHINVYWINSRMQFSLILMLVKWGFMSF